MTVISYQNKVLAGDRLTMDEALEVTHADLEALLAAADAIRQARMGQAFDLCTVVSIKTGACSEDCAFCAQSAHYETGVPGTGLLSLEAVLADAARVKGSGIGRYSLVSSGRGPTDATIDQVAEMARRIQDDLAMDVCVSLGFMTEAQLAKLKDAGISRIHCNLETGEAFFPRVCTSHHFADKVAMVQRAQEAGLEVCSGGILGLGESVQDRLDLAFALRDLGVGSVPINILIPIPGTPLADQAPLSEEDILRTIATFRFILPDAYLRLAGGRIRLENGGRAAFQGGATACISGDMLTTSGMETAGDLAIIEELGFEI